MSTLPDPQALIALSRLFSYPEAPPLPEDIQRLPEAIAIPGLTRLQNDYVRLFVNALPEAPCSPYASVYLQGMLMGPAALRLQALYRQYGFEAAEMADHIAVELEFLALLAYLVRQGEEEAGEDFIEVAAHLNTWAEDFLDRVSDRDRGGFYGGVAAAAATMLGSGMDLKVS